MLFSILWVYSSSGVCDLKKQTRRCCLLEVELLTQHIPHNQHYLFAPWKWYFLSKSSKLTRQYSVSSQGPEAWRLLAGTARWTFLQKVKLQCYIAFHALSMTEKQKFQRLMWYSCHKANSGDLPSLCNLHPANCFWMQFYARPYSPRSSPNQTPREDSWYSKTTTSNGRMGRFKS